MKGAGVRHKLAKCLLCKQDHLSSDPQDPSTKSRGGNVKPVLLTQPWGGRRSPGAYLSVSLAKRTSFGFIESPISKRQRQREKQSLKTLSGCPPLALHVCKHGQE